MRMSWKRDTPPALNRVRKKKTAPIPKSIYVPRVKEIKVAAPVNKFGHMRYMLFKNYIGQSDSVNRIRTAIDAVRVTGGVLAHMAFISDAGMGKTSLAACVATEMNITALSTVGSVVRTIEDIQALVETANGGLVFIDEAHDLVKAEFPIISVFLPLLEDWQLHTQTETIEVQPFTCIMATTQFGLLDDAIQSRMGIPYELDTYTNDDMIQITFKQKDKLQDTLQLTINLPLDSARAIACRSRENPRRCGLLMRECNNVAAAKRSYTVTLAHCQEAFETLGIDGNGLTRKDILLLRHLRSGPCSLTRCATHLGMDKRQFEKTVVAFLTSRGLIATNSKGKELTDKGREYVFQRK